MKGIAIVSGGLDSITMLYGLHLSGDNVMALSVDYGQRHKKELVQAGTICHRLGVEHHIVDMTGYGWLISNAPSSLVNQDVEVPEGSYDAESMKATVVPNRNMVMLSMAAGIAIARGANYIATAVHAGDHAIYPDCRPDFISRFESAVRVGNDGFIDPNFEVRAPYLHQTKSYIANEAARLGVPIDETWSCYKGGMFHCGRCGTCVERLEALNDAHVEDLTVYLDSNYWKQAVGK